MVTEPINYRALCAELLSRLEESDDYILKEEGTIALAARARAALAEPVAEGPTDEELYALWNDCDLGWDEQKGMVVMPHIADFARAALARWGNQFPDARKMVSHPAPVPVAVSERLPGPEDCDADGRCWWWDGEWGLVEQRFTDYHVTHWLPAHALPLPSGEVEHG